MDRVGMRAAAIPRATAFLAHGTEAPAFFGRSWRVETAANGMRKTRAKVESTTLLRSFVGVGREVPLLRVDV